MPSFVPYVLHADQHQLDRFYKKLNQSAIPLLVLLILLNELFLRKNLPQQIATPENLWSLFVLALNAKIPYEQGLLIQAGFVPLSAFYLVVFIKLPKWGLRPVKRGLKSGLPGYEDYGKACFFIETSTQKAAFWFWHSFLMRVSLFMGIFVLCALLNFVRYRFF